MSNINKIKITNHQLFSLTACGAFGGAVIIISAAIAGMAKQDAWITPLVTAVYGMAVVVNKGRE